MGAAGRPKGTKNKGFHKAVVVIKKAVVSSRKSRNLNNRSKKSQ
jgi:hypothetical protein